MVEELEKDAMVEEEKEEVVDEKEEKEMADTTENVEVAGNGNGKSVTCPKCGHKFSAEMGEMPKMADAPKPVANDNKSIPNSLPKVKGEHESNTKNISGTSKPDKMETADIYEAKYKSRLSDSIKSECKRLGRKEFEFADLDVKQLEVSERLLNSLILSNNISLIPPSLKT
jgi:hypothetical protein